MQIINGDVLCGDHSRKTAKFIRLKGVRIFKALYTLMNGYGQVVGIWFCMTESMEELQPLLKNVAKRYESFGFTGPLLFYTDSCCKERKTLKNIFATLNQGGVQVLEQEFPLLTAESLGLTITYVKDIAIANDLCEQLLKDPSLKVVGLDIEWTPQHMKVNDDDGRVATIQIATSDKGSNQSYQKHAFVFHIAQMKKPGPGPQERNYVPVKLKELLESDKICKVGRGIAGDATHLMKVGVTLKNFTDIADASRDLGLCDRATSLKRMTELLVGATLNKDYALRCCAHVSFVCISIVHLLPQVCIFMFA